MYRLQMKIAWITDPHLNFVTKDVIQRLGEAAGRADIIVITGDIAEAPTVDTCLKVFSSFAKKPIYFILGNHDFYRGSFQSVHTIAKRLHNTKSFKWLSTPGTIIKLTEKTALCGHDGWYDGRFGNYRDSTVELSDFSAILDLSYKGKKDRLAVFQELAKTSAIHADIVIRKAFEQGFQDVIFATHVPPFKEAAWHEGKPSDDDYAPYFSSQIMGEFLTKIMEDNPTKNLMVLCGHTHSEGIINPLPNMKVYTGAARYYKPSIQSTFEIE